MKLPINTIVAALTVDDDLANAVLRTAVSLSQRLGADLHVIDVSPKLQDAGFPYTKKVEFEDIDEYNRERIRRLDVLEARINALAADARVDTPVGDAPDAITTYLKSVSADLLVIGTHQKGFWEKLTTGSVSERAAHDAPCAVLLVPPLFAAKVEQTA